MSPVYTPRQLALNDRAALIRKIHVAKRTLGLDDETYRGLLARVTGKTTSGTMTTAELVAVVEEQARLGFSAAKLAVDASPALKKAQALWISLWNLGAVEDRRDTALAAFIKRQTGLDSPAWLKRPEDCVKVIEALIDMCAREGVEWMNGVCPARAVCRAQVVKMRQFPRDLAPYHDPASSDDDEIAQLYAIATLGCAPRKLDNSGWVEVSRVLGNRLRAGLKLKAKHRRTA